MNAKITLTVPIDKVHLKVGEILERISHDMEDVQVSISDVSSNVAREQDLLNQLQKIDLCRRQLGLLDANLEDCYNVLIGLISYQTKSKTDERVPNDTATEAEQR